MLTHLSINGLAIIESLAIDFTVGFNVITGETGAGKSILIKALSLLLGGKSSQESVRRGSEQATVMGRFLVREEHSAVNLLRHWGVAIDADASLSKADKRYTIEVRRIISAKGRSNAWVNQMPVTTGALKELASTLIDVFGQHDSHRLLDSHGHTSCLDQFVEPKSLVKNLQDAYSAAADLMHELRQFIDEANGKGRDVDYLAFRLEELDKFKPVADDFEHVKSLTERAKLAAGISSSLRKAQDLFEDESGDSVSKRLREISKALKQSKSADLENLSEVALQIAAEVDDLSFAIGRASSQMDITEDDIDAAETRIAGYQSLFRKHGATSVEELMQAWIKLRDQVAALENAAAHIASLLEQLGSSVQNVILHAQKLACARQEASHVVTRRVEKELSDLAMPSAKFTVEFSPVHRGISDLDLAAYGAESVSQWSDILDHWTSVSEVGLEKAEFYLAANKGEASLPLSKVASGGEVSRIMLALKKALVVGAETCVLVFDEIDTGISGRVADIVGQKIAELAGFCQIICISHLPQVAAYANRHYIVKKIEGNERTESTIMPLSPADRLEELARLLSGDKVTKASLDHAKILVAGAKSKTSASMPAQKPSSAKEEER